MKNIRHEARWIKSNILITEKTVLFRWDVNFHVRPRIFDPLSEIKPQVNLQKVN